jgi:hypothetical protein
VDDLPRRNDPQKHLHIDALTGARIEVSRDSREFVAVEAKCCRGRPKLRPMAQVAFSLFGKWCVAVLLTGNVDGAELLVHGEPPQGV